MIMTKQELINKVLVQIITDTETGDFTALDKLLTFVPEEYLQAYLPEED